MLNSGVWPERIKAASLLATMTSPRPPGLLDELRRESLDSLVEMAAWRRAGHAYFSRIVLGRVAGIPESQHQMVAEEGPVEVIIEAASKLTN